MCHYLQRAEIVLIKIHSPITYAKAQALQRRGCEGVAGNFPSKPCGCNVFVLCNKRLIGRSFWNSLLPPYKQVSFGNLTGLRKAVLHNKTSLIEEDMKGLKKDFNVSIEFRYQPGLVLLRFISLYGVVAE